MPDAPMPAPLAESVAGRRLTFFLARLRDGGAGTTDDELAAHWITDPPFPSCLARRTLLGHFAAATGPFSVRSYDVPGADAAGALLEDGRGRTWRARVQIETAPPHRMRGSHVFMAAPPGITLRSARPGDAAALRALERQCPIVTGDLRITYDRGEDYFAGARLVDNSDPVVAERDGALVGVHCMLTHELRVGGLHCSATYLHHTRILPGAQGGGLFSAMNGAELERNAHRGDVFYSYVAVGNETALRTVPVQPWSLRPERLVLDCRAQAGAPHGRPAGPGDAARVVALVNAAHAREELFVPYTAGRLAERLGRDPAYAWPHLLIGARAVVGVWSAGLRVLRETSEGREESVRALVADTGFEPGAEDELIALLRAWCTILAAKGFTHLTVFTAPGSPGRNALHALAARVEPYYFNIALPEPPDVAERGLYVDHLYF